MLARLDAPWDETRAAVLPLIGHDDGEVRADALYVVDHLSVEGDRAIVDRIDAVREAEEGRSSWNQIKGLAMPVRGRQWARINSMVRSHATTLTSCRARELRPPLRTSIGWFGRLTATLT